ncbi:MAG: ABC-2 type transport system permease protein [Parvibaculaceae bacterium]|jgi:ABC-2 type transport system permease protein
MGLIEESAMSQETLPAAGSQRRFNNINWLGLWTLYLKEVRRFVKVGTQTVGAPVANALLFLAIFSLAFGAGARPDVDGLPFVTFLCPGLIMMTMLTNSFANTSSSLMISKIQGNIVDVLMPPLSAMELNIGFALAGVTRGVVVGLVTGLGMWVFVGDSISVYNIAALIFYAVSASLMLSLLGILTGIWAEKFDHLQAITNFVITPMAFLSGTFYAVRNLPDLAYSITQFNPFFYLIDGFRFAMTGRADGSIMTGVITITAINIVLWFVSDHVLRRGYRLKA